jgi:hypothetical protein
MIEGKEYATYQFAHSSYSSSRATLVFITSKAILLELTSKVPDLFNIKQEYTDIWILGIKDLDKNIISEVDNKIISTFFQKIVKYRSDNDLPPYTLQRLENDKIFLATRDDICKFISCRKRSYL